MIISCRIIFYVIASYSGSSHRAISYRLLSYIVTSYGTLSCEINLFKGPFLFLQRSCSITSYRIVRYNINKPQGLDNGIYTVLYDVAALRKQCM